MDILEKFKNLKLSRSAVIIVSILGVLIVGGIAYKMVSSPSDGKGGKEDLMKLFSKKERAFPVEVQEAEVGKMSKVMTSVGTLIAHQYVDIKTDLPGRVKNILFTDGFSVKKDDVLIEFDDDMQKADVKLEEATYAHNKAKFERTQELHGKQYSSSKERDKDLAELKQSEARLEVAKVKLAKTKLLAPFDGVVGILRNISVGAFVQQQTDLVTLVNLNPIRVDFKIPGSYLKSVKVGQKVKITVDGYEADLVEGEIEAIDSKVETVGHGLLVRAKISNQDGRLKPGLFARVSVVVGENDKAIIIPEKAVERNGNEEFILTVANGRAMKVQVITGVKEDGKVEILKGLKPQQTVIVAGQARDGYPVAVNKLLAPELSKK
jgi:membrane fusion protein (multidrug efflux system)